MVALSTSHLSTGKIYDLPPKLSNSAGDLFSAKACAETCAIQEKINRPMAASSPKGLFAIGLAVRTIIERTGKYVICRKSY